MVKNMVKKKRLQEQMNLTSAQHEPTQNSGNHDKFSV